MSGLSRAWVSMLVLVMVTACGSPVYIAEDIDGQVVDVETGEPIKDANVIANWQLVQSTLDSDRMMGQLEVMETVTDKDGRFHFDGFVRFNWPNKFLRNSDPQVIIFRPGYEHARVANYYPRAGTQTPGMIRKGAANNRVIKLKQLDLTKEVRKSDQDIMVYTQTKIDIKELTTFAKDCEWKKIPKLILAMDAEKKRIMELYPLAYVGLVGVDDIHMQSGCGSAKSYFEGKIQ